MDALVRIYGREDSNLLYNKDLAGDICFTNQQEAGCTKTRSFTGHPYRPEHWWVTDLDIAMLSTVEVL
jgi:hypothetical protein